MKVISPNSYLPLALGWIDGRWLMFVKVRRFPEMPDQFPELGTDFFEALLSSGGPKSMPPEAGWTHGDEAFLEDGDYAMGGIRRGNWMVLPFKGPDKLKLDPNRAVL